MADPIVFIDVAGPDDDELSRFYASVFGWETDAAGKPMGLVEMDGDRPRIP